MRTRVGGAPKILPLVVVSVAVGLALASCGGGGGGSSPQAVTQTRSSGEASLADVTSADQLRARFNEDAGVPRLLLLLSPT